MAGLLSLVIGFATGVALESILDTNLSVVAWVLGLALVVSVVWRRARASACPAPYLAWLSIFLICVALGLVRTQVYEEQFDDSLASVVDTEIEFSGQVVKDPDIRTSQQQLYVSYQDEIILVSTERSTEVQYGDTVEVRGVLKEPEVFVTDIGRTFDYVHYLEAKGIEYRMSFASVTQLDSDGGNIILRTLLTAKHWFMDQLDIVFSEPNGSLADGLLLGLNQGLGEDLEEDFRRSGIIHIVVLSGYNIMLVVTFVLFLLSFFMRERWRMVSALGAIISFALIVGLSATVVRASIMAALLIIAQTYGRTYDVLRALLLAGFIMIVLNPYLLLFDIGFQLSFMATLGLIAVLPWLDAHEQPEVLTSVRGYVGATIATQIAVLPLLLYHIGQVSLVAVMVNVLVLPVVPVAMLGTFIAGMLQPFLPAVSLGLGYLTELVLGYIILVAQFFSALPLATIEVSSFPAWGSVLLYGVIGLCSWLVVHRDTTSHDYGDWEIVAEETIKNDTKQVVSSQDVPKLFR